MWDRKFIVAFIVLAISTYSKNIYMGTNDVVIDLTSETIKAKNGINVKQGNMELKAFDIRRDKKSKKYFVDGDLQTLITNKSGNLYLESQKGGNITYDGKDGVLYKNYGFLDVGSMTNAKYPNQNIYFGGDKIVLKDGNLYIDNGWFTTDFNIQKSKNPKKAGYSLVADKIIIEPNKQITLKNINFYNETNKRTPVAFPFYRANIRKGSKVPLFPTFITDTYYGFETSVGVLYGDKKFRGGFAPKFADRMGWLIGRMENWYNSPIGDMHLDIDDWLVYKKVKKLKKGTPGEMLKNEERTKRYKFTYTHNYSGKYGDLNLSVIKSTYNMIPKLNNIITNYTDNGRFKKNRPKLTKSINFYSGKTNLKIGDMTLKSNLKLTNDKKGYGLMVYEDINGIGYGSSVDHDLFSQVSLYKDNKHYKIGGYYTYLYDIDPGSNFSDTQSRAENFGFTAKEKKHGIGLTYTSRRGNKFRPLGLWERNPGERSKVSYAGYGANFKFDYIPTMVEKYKIDNEKNLNISFGKYDVFNGFTLQSGYLYKNIEKKLDLTKDTARHSVKSLRGQQFNRFDNVIYNHNVKRYIYVEVKNGKIVAKTKIGTKKSTIYDRIGRYDGGYSTYINNSKFYTLYLERNEIPLGNFGNIALFGRVKANIYDTNNDKTLKSTFGLRHIAEIIDNGKNQNRSVDLKVINDLSASLSKYTYKMGDVDKKSYRLKNKENRYKVQDKINIFVGNTETIYNFSYIYGKNPTTNKKSSTNFNNQINFKINGDKKLVLNYGENKKFNDVNTTKTNYNHFANKNYGAKYYLGDHSFSYDKTEVISKIKDLPIELNNGKSLANATEKIDMQTFGYGYKFDINKINLAYSQGKDTRNNEHYGNVIDVDNKVYKINFTRQKEKISHSYGIKYETFNHREKSSRKLVIDGKKYNSSNSDILTMNYEYKDANFDKNELSNLAIREFGSSSEMNIDKIKNILEHKQNTHLNFALNDNIYTKFDNMANFRKNFKLSLTLKKNSAKYKQSRSYANSLSQIKLGVFYTQNRYGLGYDVEENAGWINKKFKKKNREHKISLMGAIGKPSQSYTLKTYAKFYQNLIDKDSTPKRKPLDGIGVEIGREFDYYKWSIAFEKRYVLANNKYEWRGALQFTLLTFPDNPLLGLGAQRKPLRKIKPKVNVMSGIKVSEVVD